MINKLKCFNKIRYILPVTLIIGMITIGLTIASLKTSTQTLTNKFSAGEVTTEIDEGNPSAVDGYIEKKPYVVNNGPNDCLVRVRVTVSPSEFEDLLENKSVSIDYNEDFWFYSDDGYWYYKDILKSENRTTKPLFNKIEGLTSKVGDTTVVNDEYKELFNDIEITIYEESVQAIVYDSDGDYISAYDKDDNYNHDEAMKIWNLYDQGLLNIETNSQN